MIEKSTVLVIRIHKRVKSIVFAMPITFCDESGLAILSVRIPAATDLSRKNR